MSYLQQFLGMVSLAFVWIVPLWAYEVQVSGDAYIELHTGPGRSFPIFHIVEHGNNVSILKQKTDWYLVRAARNKVGWVHSDQMATTVIMGKDIVRFEAIIEAQHHQQNIGVGFAAGFIDGDDTASFNVDYRFTQRWLGGVTLANAAGILASTRLLYGSGSVELFHFKNIALFRRIVPYLTVGLGVLKSEPAVVVASVKTTEQSIANIGFGVKAQLGNRLYWQTMTKWHVAIDGRDGQYFDLQTGFITFF